MKQSIVLVLTDEELVELFQILQDRDEKGALKFLEKHLKTKLQEVTQGLGHCKPWFEWPGR